MYPNNCYHACAIGVCKFGWSTVEAGPVNNSKNLIRFFSRKETMILFNVTSLYAPLYTTKIDKMV